MAKPRMDLSAFVGKLLEEQDGDVLREGIRVLSQALMETEVAGLDRRGAPRAHAASGRRTATATGCGRGTRGWARSSWRFRRSRPGTYFPVAAAAAPARRARAAGGRAGSVRARRLDAEGRRADEGAWAWTASRSRRSRGSAASSIPLVDGVPHAAADGRVSVPVGRCDVPQGARRRPRDQPGDRGRRRRHAARASARSSGSTSGPSEDRAFWTAFLRSLVKRGLRGVRLVISDAHEGLKQAIATVLSGATWQRCRVHFMRNLLATVPQGAREAIAAVVRTIFAQPDHASAHDAAAQGRRRPARRGLRRPPRCSRTPPRTSWRTGICRSSTSGSCTARIRSSG